MASAKGMKIADAGRDVSEVMEDGVITSGADRSANAQGGQPAVSMPRKFQTKDAMDDRMRQRMQLMDDKGMTPFGQVYYDDSVGRWLEKKEAATELANMDAWFGKNYNKASIAERQFAQQIYPEYYTEREKLMMEKAAMVVKLKAIQLRGPRNKEDLMLQYLVQSGKVQLPADWDKIGISTTEERLTDAQMTAQRANFARGLVRLPRFLTEREMQQNAATATTLGGNPANTAYVFGNQLGGVVPSQNRLFPNRTGPTLAREMINTLQ